MWFGHFPPIGALNYKTGVGFYKHLVPHGTKYAVAQLGLLHAKAQSRKVTQSCSKRIFQATTDSPDRVVASLSSSILPQIPRCPTN